MSILSGFTFSSEGNYSGNVANVLTTLNISIVSEFIRPNTPVITSFGFHSVPADNLTAIHNGTPMLDSSVVMGYLNPCAPTPTSNQDNIKDLKKGESEIFNSFDFALRMEKEKINAKYRSLETRINNGENVMNLMLEIYSQMNQLINLMDTNWTIYNNHIHELNPHEPTLTLKPEGPYQVIFVEKALAGTLVKPQTFFTTIKNELGSGQTMHITSNGIQFPAYTGD